MKLAHKSYRTNPYHSRLSSAIIACGLLLFILIFACKDALVENPKSALTPGNFYITASDAQLAVNAAYDHMGSGLNNSNFGGVYFNSYYSLQALASDNGKAGPQNEPNTVQLDLFRHDPSNTFTTDIWEDCYKTISLANIAIERIPDIDMDEQLKNRFLGEVHFIRGLMYFELVRLFGAVPLLTTPTIDLSILTIERTSADEVYLQILADMEIAELTLPFQYTGADIGRATKGAAVAYLARVYMTLENWAEVVDKTNTVIGFGFYQLMEDYADVFKIQNNNGPEVVFATQFTLNNDAIWETSQFNVRTLPLALNRNSLSWELPTLDVYRAFDIMDRRWEVTFQTSFEENDGTVVNFEPHIFKYWDQVAEPSASSGGNDFFNMRYSDVLLMHAEALNEMHAGPTAEAYIAVNKVRQRARFADGTERNTLPDLEGLSFQEFREAIWQERRFEFVWEGQRWFDLVRQDRLKSRVEEAKDDVTVEIPKHNLFPIPQRERNINPNLTQNPGY
ncbi:MAG: RagB/SusD family nutrient uptake outer membrane protein [Bacteroidetes bacterium]|nr:MAG: RagB/SusD family nutrient uptake outer membrane protein [Bacteroidota bacterium]